MYICIYPGILGDFPEIDDYTNILQAWERHFTLYEVGTETLPRITSVWNVNIFYPIKVPIRANHT